MSLPVFYGELTAHGARLTGAEAHHAATVRRLRVGERVVVADGLGRGVVGAVMAAGRSEVVVAAEAQLAEPEPRPRVVVVQALVKGDAAGEAVALLTEVGVDVVVPWAAERSVVRLDADGPARLQRRWGLAAREASKQARRLRATVVEPVATSDDVAELLDGAARGVVLHESASVPLTASPDERRDGDVVVVVGPEGGLSPGELDHFGDRAVRLGPTVLRAAHAGAAAAVLLLSGSGRWDATRAAP